jgi:hypothetical protein
LNEGKKDVGLLVPLLESSVVTVIASGYSYKVNKKSQRVYTLSGLPEGNTRGDRM